MSNETRVLKEINNRFKQSRAYKMVQLKSENQNKLHELQKVDALLKFKIEAIDK